MPRLVGTAWEVKLAFLGHSPEPRSGATPPTAAFWLGSSEGTRLERIRYAVFPTAFSPALHSLGIFMQQTAFKRWAQLKEVTESVGFQFDCPAIPPGSTMAWTSSNTMTTVTAMMALLLNRGDIKRCSGGGIASGGGGCGGCGVKLRERNWPAGPSRVWLHVPRRQPSLLPTAASSWKACRMLPSR